MDIFFRLLPCPEGDSIAPGANPDTSAHLYLNIWDTIDDEIRRLLSQSILPQQQQHGLNPSAALGGGRDAACSPHRPSSPSANSLMPPSTRMTSGRLSSLSKSSNEGEDEDQRNRR